MSVDAARLRLRHLHRRWIVRRFTGAGLVFAASTGLAVALSERLPIMVAVGAAAAVAVGAWALVFRRGGGGLAEVAHHLDRTVPELEESADLVLADSEALGALERLQQARVAARMQALPEVRLPRWPLLRGAAIAAGVAGVGVLALLAPRQDASLDGSRSSRSRSLSERPALGEAEIVVRPPAYTRLPARTAAWDLEVESGAMVTWRVRADGADRVRLVRIPAETLSFRRDGHRWTVTLEATDPSVYQLVAENQAGPTRGPIHRLAVRPDEPPSLSFVVPAGRTVLAPTASRQVRVEVRASDDYGLAESGLLATVASGAGEQVKFRERRLALGPTPQGAVESVTLRRTLDLAALGMRPGDEVYLTAVARDVRRPAAQEGRSETVIVAIADTSAAELAEFAGLPAVARPAYLRGQRQIILDTERLLRERARVTREAFNSRAAAIGDDQRVLRLRYAEMLGGETVGDAADRATPDPAAAAGTLSHEHDTEENATLLSPEVKRALTAAVAQMWEAERNLGTFDPAAALPHEYGALERLKEVQRSGRAYVQRTGGGGPTLDLSRRLMGELKGARESSESTAVEVRVALPASRAALSALQRIQAGVPAGPESRATLAAALDEVAARAVAGTVGALQTARALQAVIDSIASPAPCGGCLGSAERGLWALLPPAEPAPAAGAPTGRVGRYYLDLLGRER